MYSQLKKFCDNECSKYNIKLNCLFEGEIEINPILYNTIIELEITVLFQTNIDLNVFPYLMKLTINYPLMSINLNKIMNETILLDLIKINIPTYSDEILVLKNYKNINNKIISISECDEEHIKNLLTFSHVQ